MNTESIVFSTELVHKLVSRASEVMSDVQHFRQKRIKTMSLQSLPNIPSQHSKTASSSPEKPKNSTSFNCSFFEEVDVDQSSPVPRQNIPSILSLPFSESEEEEENQKDSVVQSDKQKNS